MFLCSIPVVILAVLGAGISPLCSCGLAEPLPQGSGGPGRLSYGSLIFTFDSSCLQVHLVTCSAFLSSANKYEFLDMGYVSQASEMTEFTWDSVKGEQVRDVLVDEFEQRISHTATDGEAEKDREASSSSEASAEQQGESRSWW